MAEPNRLVVLIEDNDSHARIVERHLSRAAEFRLERCATLRAGLDRLRRGPVDVVLLDLSLPDSPRDETLGRVLEVASDVPIVVLTTAEDLDAAVRSVQQGAQDDLPKNGLSPELLNRALRYAIERKQSELRVRASERLYRAIGESIDFGVWVCDAQGRNLYTSPSLLRLVGLTQEECSDFGWGRVLHPDDRERTMAAWKECVCVGGVWNIENRFRGTDGAYHPVLARGVPVHDDRGRVTHWAGINLDISDMKRVEEQLRLVNATLEERVAERTAVAEDRAEKLRRLATELSAAEHKERRRIARLIHDHLQQVLAAAKMRTDMLIQAMPAGRPQEMVRQVDELLQKSLADARSLTLDLSPPVLSDRGLGAALEWLARQTKQHHGLETAVVRHGDDDHLPEGVAALLFEATRELLFNTVKHARVVAAAVTLDCTNPQAVRLRVEDAGAGFDAGEFARGETGGEHFGLFSIRERLVLAGGGMRIESAPGRGTRVELDMPLPRASAHGAPEAAGNGETADGRAATGSGASAAAGDAIRVLLVDDHRVVREGLASLLDNQPDITIVGQAENGAAAVRLTEELRPAVVVLDVSLPDQSGVEVARQIMRRWPQTRIIALSMHDPADYESPMRSAGATCYLSKGGPTEPLLRSIRAGREESAVGR